MKDIRHVQLYYRDKDKVTFDKYQTNGEEPHHHDKYQIEFIFKLTVQFSAGQ